jgi:uncharacterized protein YcfJ
MKAHALALVLPLLVSTQARAFEAVATVISVSPVTETVNHPSQRCWTEYQHVQQVAPPEYHYGGAILGGIVGGLLGSLMGEGNGKVAAAAVSAGVGAIAGDRIANANANAGQVYTSSTPIQRCEQVSNAETRTTYQVTYEYGGQRFMTRLPYDPGSQLRVNVSVTPK